MSLHKNYLRVAGALLVSLGSAALAADVAASLDTRTCKVDYPKASLMNEEQGTVRLAFQVAADGTVTDSQVEKSSGFKNLDKAAIKGLSACKFKPGTKDGNPAASSTKVDYAWKLD